jgi:hypothetical protein
MDVFSHKIFMHSHQPSEDSTLLERVLSPLLDDFRYWFNRSLERLEQPVSCLTPEQQDDLVQRLKTALAEIRTAATLLEATDGQVGVDTSQVMGWHGLVAECWSVARRQRSESA